MKDDFVSIEHLILAVFKSKSKIAQMLKDQGVTEKGIKCHDTNYVKVKSNLSKSRGNL